MVNSTFVNSAGSCTQGVWQFLDKASQADVGVRLVEMEHTSRKKMLSYYSIRVLIYAHCSFYRTLNLKFPMDVVGLSRDDRVTTEIGTGSLGHAVVILTREDFKILVDIELAKWA